MRESEDAVEQAGIERTRQMLSAPTWSCKCGTPARRPPRNSSGTSEARNDPRTEQKRSRRCTRTGRLRLASGHPHFLPDRRGLRGAHRRIVDSALQGAAARGEFHRRDQRPAPGLPAIRRRFPGSGARGHGARASHRSLSPSNCAPRWTPWATSWAGPMPRNCWAKFSPPSASGNDDGPHLPLQKHPASRAVPARSRSGPPFRHGGAALPAGRLRRAGIDPRLERTVFGLRFPNPIGLAAGFDKNAVALPAWETLGFGFVEAGTITARRRSPETRSRASSGCPEQRALINRLGFNNDGAEAVAARLAG